MSPSTAAILAELEGSGIRLGLEAMRARLASLGDPQERLPHLLVAGTNGKGSTAALLHAMLVAAGYRSGLYTSPHLESPRERLRVDGVALDHGRFRRWLTRALSAGGRSADPPTYFEALTLAAFVGFADTVEIAVLEVGLGGRLDATNVGRPCLSIVTEIGLDHVELLGGTKEAVAREKAGVFRRGAPAILGARDPLARDVLLREAARRGAIAVDAFEGTRWRGDGELTTPAAGYRLAPPLAGAHQRANLVVAVRAAEELAALGWNRLAPQAIETGARRCRWPGRLEEVVLPAGERLVLDAAHNPQAAAAVAAALRAERPWTLVFGALSDKDAGGALASLLPIAGRVVLTTPPAARGRPAASLRDAIGDREPIVEPDPRRATLAALELGRPVLVCGSIYLVGAVRRMLRQRFGTPPPAVEIDVAGAQAG